MADENEPDRYPSPHASRPPRRVSRPFWQNSKVLLNQQTQSRRTFRRRKAFPEQEYFYESN